MLQCNDCILLCFLLFFSLICTLISIYCYENANLKLRKELDEYKTKDLIKSTIEEIVK